MANQVHWEDALCKVLSGTRTNNPEPVPRGHLVLAQDTEAGGKQYATVPYDSLPQFVDGLAEERRCLYAMMTLCFGVDIYLDLEHPTEPPGAPVLVIQARLWESLAGFLRSNDWEPQGLLVLQSSTTRKSSFHWHVRLARPWRHVGHVAAVMRAWYATLAPELRVWVDHSVYDQNRCFRLMRCKKRNKRDGVLLPLTAADLPTDSDTDAAPCVTAFAAAMAALRPASDEEALLWSACVRPLVPQSECAEAPREMQAAEKLKTANGKFWDVAAALARYSDPGAGWLTKPLLPPTLWLGRSIEIAMGARVNGSTDEPTHFWRCGGVAAFYRPACPKDVRRAVCMRLASPNSAPVFLNEATGRGAFRRPWLDLDHLGPACATTEGAVTTTQVLDACIAECAALLTDPRCLLVMAGVPNGACPPLVRDGCHIRFPQAKLTHAEHVALVAAVGKALEARFGTTVAACVDPNCLLVRTVWSDKAEVDEPTWTLVPAGRVLRVHAQHDPTEGWSEWAELGPMRDLERASVLCDGSEAGGATEALQALARAGTCRPWKAGGGGKAGAGGEAKSLPSGTGPMVEALLKDAAAKFGCSVRIATARLEGDASVSVLTTPTHTCPAGSHHRNPWPLRVFARPATRVAWLNCINAQTDANGHGGKNRSTPGKPTGSVCVELDDGLCRALLRALFPDGETRHTAVEALVWDAVRNQLPAFAREPGITRMTPETLVVRQEERLLEWPPQLVVNLDRQTVAWYGKAHRVPPAAFRQLHVLGLILAPQTAPARLAHAERDLLDALRDEPVVKNLGGVRTGCVGYARHAGAAVGVGAQCEKCNGHRLLFLLFGAGADEALVQCERCGARDPGNWLLDERERAKAAADGGVVEAQMLFACAASAHASAHRVWGYVRALCAAPKRAAPDAEKEKKRRRPAG